MVYKSINGLALEYLSNLFTNLDSVTSNSLRDTESKLAIEMCVSFVVLKYLVMTSFRGLRQSISTYNAVFNSQVQM